MSENQANPPGDDRTGELPPAADAATPEPFTPEPSTPEPSTAPPSPAGPEPQYRVPQAPPAATPYPPDQMSQQYQQYPGYPPPIAAPQSGGQPYPMAPYPAAGPPPPYSGGTQIGPVRRWLLPAAAGLAIAVTGGAVGGFVGYSVDGGGSPLQVPAATGNGSAAPVIDRSSLASIAAALQPAIVDIRTNAGEGSGVVISTDGHIVTNNHVLAGARSNSVRVTFNSGQQVTATVVGTDPKTDIAVIRVDADDLNFAPWGDSESVQVGDTVLAIGSPLGLQGSVTAGIVSALHRTITVSEDQRSQFDTGNSTTIGDAIQTDAPINAGNSGGALVNMRGEVVGINTAIATSGVSGNIGVGFAISSNRARTVAEALIAGEDVTHPFIGVQISNDDEGGARIESVVEGSPAAQAGLEAGDVVTKVGDRPIRGAEDLIGAIQSSSVGAQLTLTLRDGGSERTVTVTVGEQ